MRGGKDAGLDEEEMRQRGKLSIGGVSCGVVLRYGCAMDASKASKGGIQEFGPYG